MHLNKLISLPSQGLKFSKCYRTVDWQCKEILHYGAIWQRQPQDLMLHVSGTSAGLLSALLYCLQDPELMSSRGMALNSHLDI